MPFLSSESLELRGFLRSALRTGDKARNGPLGGPVQRAFAAYRRLSTRRLRLRRGAPKKPVKDQTARFDALV